MHYVYRTDCYHIEFSSAHNRVGRLKCWELLVTYTHASSLVDLINHFLQEIHKIVLIQNISS